MTYTYIHMTSVTKVDYRGAAAHKKIYPKTRYFFMPSHT